MMHGFPTAPLYYIFLMIPDTAWMDSLQGDSLRNTHYSGLMILLRVNAIEAQH